MEIEYKFDPGSGKLGILEFKKLNFTPARIYWISGFVAGSSRGNHAHKTLRQAMFVIAGHINVKLCEGNDERIIKMQPSEEVLYVDPGIWREIWTDEPGSILCVLCDQPFSEADYIRDFKEYLSWFEANNES